MKRIERRFEDVKDEIIEIHEIARRGVEICLKALSGDDESKIESVRIEQRADVLDTEINYDCTHIIALFQPVARDLRTALSYIRISSAYERITDLTNEIAMYDVDIPEEFYDMQRITLKMFDTIKKAYVGKEVDLKEDLICEDDELDLFYTEFIEKVSDRRCHIREVVDIILIARHLERIGDLLLKIGKWLIFINEGKMMWLK